MHLVHSLTGILQFNYLEFTAHLVLVTASVVSGLYKELAPEHEEECTPLPPSDCKWDNACF